jgi:hypothetical protein
VIDFGPQAAQVAVTWSLVGLIWTIQLVHYPLMSRVGEARYVEYQREHMRRITWLVGPLMLAEVGLALALWLGAATPDEERLGWIGALLLLVIWGATAVFSVPAHGRLEAGFDERAHARLVATNWVRTAAWTLRGGVVLLWWAEVAGSSAGAGSGGSLPAGS